MRLIPSAAVALLVSLLAGAATAADGKQALSGKVLVMAAASTTDAIDEIRAAFVKLHPNVTVRVSYGASSTLAQQIEKGAGADVFLPASEQWAQFLEKKMLVERNRDLLGNVLVIVTPADSKLSIASPKDLAQADVRHLALADPSSVPAGIYARQALEKLKLWKSVEGKVAGAADVRQALHFVETGAAEAGIVYATDAASGKGVKIVARIAPELTEPIRYPAVLLKHAQGNAAAVAFDAFLTSPAASDVFRRRGFVVLADSPTHP